MTVFMNTILEPVEIVKVNTKSHIAKTVPASYMRPLQTVPDPLESKDLFVCVCAFIRVG